MPAAKYRGKYPQYPKPEKYQSLRYRVSNEQTLEALYEGLKLLLGSIEVLHMDYDLIVEEFERLGKLIQARKDYKILMARRKARRNENSPNH